MIFSSFSCFKPSSLDVEEASDSPVESDVIESDDDFDLSSHKVDETSDEGSGEEARIIISTDILRSGVEGIDDKATSKIPETREVPLSPREFLNSQYKKSLQDETSYWEQKYLTDAELQEKYPDLVRADHASKHDPEFRRKIDKYAGYRQKVMRLKDEGASVQELDRCFEQLGSMLADAYSMVDPQTGQWTQEVKDATNRGGKEYSIPSVRAFLINLLPNVGRLTVNSLTRIFCDEDNGSVVRHVTNCVFPFVQVPVSIYASQKNGEWQSVAVQLQKSENPTWTPNVVSSQILNEDGTVGKLRHLSDVYGDLKDLQSVEDLIAKELEIKPFQKKQEELKSKIVVAQIDLQTMVTDVCRHLVESMQSGKSAPLNDIENQIIDAESPLKTRINQLLKVTSGRAALTSSERQEAGRKLKQLELWGMLDKELDAAIGTCERNGQPEVGQALRRALTETSFEAMKMYRYRMLNVLNDQAFVRHIRTAFFMGMTLSQLSHQVVQYITGDDGAQLGSDFAQLLLTAAQFIHYAIEYPKATGQDARRKLATQCVIIAMTRNFIGDDGKVDPKRLDKAVTGPVMTVLSTFASLLKFDQAVYMQALFSWMVDPRTLDNDEAEKVEVEGEEIACTYMVLSDEFSKLKSREDRKAFVDGISKQRPEAQKNKVKIDRFLELFENNEVNLKNKGDASQLLDEHISKLPAKTREMLDGSLDYVTYPATRSANKPWHRLLFKLAGKIEQQGDAPFQPAQKLGQAFTFIWGGTGGIFFLKAVFIEGVELAIVAGKLTATEAEALADGILGAKIIANLFALASLIFTLGLNGAYHEFISTKNKRRQDALGGPSIVSAPPPTLRGSLWQEFLAHLGYKDAREEQVMGYDTLVGTPIPRKDWPPLLKFVRPTSLPEAMWEQMFAPDVNSWLSYFHEKHGTLEGKSTEDLEKAIEEDLKKLGGLLDDWREPASTHDAGKERSEGGNKKIEELEVIPEVIAVPPEKPARVPRLTLKPMMSALPLPISPIAEVTPRTINTARRAEESTEVFTPRAMADANKKEKKQSAATKTKRDNFRTGVSRMGPFRPYVDPADTTHFDDGKQEIDDDNVVIESDEDSMPPPLIAPPARQPLKYDRVEPLGLNVEMQIGKKGPVFYLSRDLLNDPNPIQAYSIPDEDGRGPLHLVNHRYPGLAVVNMLQLDLGDFENWDTLSTDSRYIQFFASHLRGPSQEEASKRLAAPPMKDFAAFTQQMALDRPNAGWRPMTTATMRYVDEAMQSFESCPPVLSARQSFGVSYEGRDLDGNTAESNSVVLRFDSGSDTYFIINPKSASRMDTGAEEPQEALRIFMQTITREQPDLDTTFSVLYHVAPTPNEGNDDTRQMVINAQWNSENLISSWIQRTVDVSEAMPEIETALVKLEAENSYLLLMQDRSEDNKEWIADQVKTNRRAIGVLGRAYSGMAVMADMPDLAEQ